MIILLETVFIWLVVKWFVLLYVTFICFHWSCDWRQHCVNHWYFKQKTRKMSVVAVVVSYFRDFNTKQRCLFYLFFFLLVMFHYLTSFLYNTMCTCDRFKLYHNKLFPQSCMVLYHYKYSTILFTSVHCG